MTDAKELVERLNTALKYVIGWNTADQRAARQAVNDARDWIERWASVTEKVRAVIRAQEAVRQYGVLAVDQLHQAQSELASAAIAALGEDKP